VGGDEIDRIGELGWSRQMFQISPVVTGTLTDFLIR